MTRQSIAQDLSTGRRFARQMRVVVAVRRASVAEVDVAMQENGAINQGRVLLVTARKARPVPRRISVPLCLVFGTRVDTCVVTQAMAVGSLARYRGGAPRQMSFQSTQRYRRDFIATFSVSIWRRTGIAAKRRMLHGTSVSLLTT